MYYNYIVHEVVLHVPRLPRIRDAKSCQATSRLPRIEAATNQWCMKWYMKWRS